MNFLTVGKALKFYDVKPEQRVRLWFVLLVAIFAAGFLVPFANSDFSGLLQRLLQFAEGQGTLPQLESGHWNFLGMQVLARFIGMIAGIDYLRHFLTANASAGGRIPLQTWLRIIVFQVLAALVYLISSPFFLIPYLIFISAFFFVPPEMLKFGGSIGKSMQQSYLLGRGMRLQIASSVVMLTAAFMLLDMWFTPLANNSTYGVALIGGFLFAWEILSRAKLAGVWYELLVRKAQVEQPLKPK